MALDARTISLELTQTWFYLKYAALLGHELNLNIDTNGEKLTAEQTYRYDMGEQGLREVTNGEITSDHIKLLRLIATKSLKILAQVGGIDEILPTCFALAREHAAV